MRILITGASGDLGGKLRKYFQAKHDLVLLDIEACLESSIHTIDLSSDIKNWDYLFEGVDAVIHMAANSNYMAEWPDLIKPNIDALLNLYEVCARYKVPRVVFASSSHVLGGYQKYDPVPVLNSDTKPLPSTPYAATKLFGERVARQYSLTHAITSICIRIGWNQRGGADDASLLTNDWLRKFWISDRDFCHLIECCISVSSIPKWSVINGVSNNTGTHWDISEARALLEYQPQDNAFDLFDSD